MDIFKKVSFFLSLVFLAPGYASAQVSVYAEGAYTDTDLAVYIYADITASTSDEALLSYGVTLKYNSADFESPVVKKNTSAWYFGDQDDPYSTPNAEPDTSTAGEVIIIGGKIDSAAPLEGVSGERVLLATVTFDRLTTDSPTAELYLGKGGSYANFVQINGIDLDQTLAGEDESGTIGQVDIFQRGDANGDSKVSMQDISTVYSMVLNAQFRCYADANGDGEVSMLDINEVRNIILGF